MIQHELAIRDLFKINNRKTENLFSVTCGVLYRDFAVEADYIETMWDKRDVHW
jgi:hypothetical protein